jgi:ABC-2 type transport system permease protein
LAELSGSTGALAAMTPIPARVQLVAVAWLRWRLFVNTFFRRRSKGKLRIGGLVFAIVLRIFLWPVLAVMVLGPVAFSGFLAWELMSEGHLRELTPVLAGLMIFWQFVSINGMNIATATKTFDPSTLTRFPIPFPRYLALRTLIGLMTPSTIVGCLASLAVAVGIGIARRDLLLPALMAMAAFALMNVFFTRMLGAWFDRWMANRRFRELFAVLMATSFVWIQLAIPTRSSMHEHAGHAHQAMTRPDLTRPDLTHPVMMPWYMRAAHNWAATLGWLPPGLTAHAILSGWHLQAVLPRLAGLLLYAALFLAIFAVRLHKQFLGELLVDSPSVASKAPARRAERIVKAPAAGAAATSRARVSASSAESSAEHCLIPPVIAACMRKEFMVLKSNTQALIGLFMPLIFVFILERGPAARHVEYFLPTALGYVLLGPVAAFYNVFGADGSGVQFYFMAPIKISNVIVAKNMTQLTLVAVEVAAAWGLVLLLAQDPIPLSVEVATGLWLIFFVATNLAFGTLRSVQAPRRYVPGQTRQLKQTTPTNRTSSLLVLAVLLGGLVVQGPITYAGHYFHLPWLGAAVFAVLAAGAVGLYLLLLRSAEGLTLKYRDRLTEELCKTG